MSFLQNVNMFIWKSLVNNSTLPNQGRHVDRTGDIP